MNKKKEIDGLALLAQLVPKVCEFEAIGLLEQLLLRHGVLSRLHAQGPVGGTPQRADVEESPC